jgi:hypothetical protein
MKKEYPPLPTGFRPEVLRRLSMKEFLVIVSRYGAEAIGQRMEFDDKFIGFIREIIKE